MPPKRKTKQAKPKQTKVKSRKGVSLNKSKKNQVVNVVIDQSKRTRAPAHPKETAGKQHQPTVFVVHSGSGTSPHTNVYSLNPSSLLPPTASAPVVSSASASGGSTRSAVPTPSPAPRTTTTDTTSTSTAPRPATAETSGFGLSVGSAVGGDTGVTRSGDESSDMPISGGGGIGCVPKAFGAFGRGLFTGVGAMARALTGGGGGDVGITSSSLGGGSGVIPPQVTEQSSVPSDFGAPPAPPPSVTSVSSGGMRDLPFSPIQEVGETASADFFTPPPLPTPRPRGGGSISVSPSPHGKELSLSAHSSPSLSAVHTLFRSPLATPKSASPPRTPPFSPNQFARDVDWVNSTPELYETHTRQLVNDVQQYLMTHHLASEKLANILTYGSATRKKNKGYITTTLNNFFRDHGHESNPTIKELEARWNVIKNKQTDLRGTKKGGGGGGAAHECGGGFCSDPSHARFV